MKEVYRYASLLFIAVATLMLSSCDSDDEPYYYDDLDPRLVGEWVLVSNSGPFDNEFIFYSNGTGSYYVNDSYGPTTYYINWWTYGDNLTVDFPNQGGDQMYFSYEFMGGYLYLYPSSGGTWIYEPY